jgi:hypothetical protein
MRGARRTEFEKTCVRILAARTARALRPSRPSRLRERAQGRPGAGCTRGPRATKSTGVGPQVNRSNAGLPCTMVLTVSFVLSPVTGLSCHRRPRQLLLLAGLAPASGRQDHTTSPSALAGVRRSPALASTASRRAFVTIAIRPSCRAGQRLYRGDLGAKRSGLFLALRLDGSNRVDRIEQIRPTAQHDGNLLAPSALKLHVGNIYPT